MSANSNLETALRQAADELDAASIPYMLIGGLALSAWALPRATIDIDLTLWVDAEDLDEVCLRLCTVYIPRPEKPAEFVRKTRVLPVTTTEGIRLDFLFAAFPFEKTMLDRAVVRPIGSASIRVASREDLILLKLPSPRPRDQEDVRLLLETYRGELDWDYLLSVATLLGEALDQPQLAATLEKYRARH
jgi:nucleotidyltransferase AbiEii toxin of type IV toxin-antitoxin system